MAYREYTVKLLEAIQEGLIDRDAVISAALQVMSEDEVRDMMFANDFAEDTDDWDEDEDEERDPMDDFNYVGSRHHY